MKQLILILISLLISTTHLAADFALPKGSFSFAAWVKTSEDKPAVIIKPAKQNSGFAITATPLNYTLTTYNNDKQVALTASLAPKTNQTQHIAFTFTPYCEPDKNGACKGTIMFYIDGVIVDIFPETEYRYSAENKLVIEGDKKSCSTEVADELKIFDEVISKSQIESLAKTPKTNQLPDSPQVEWININGTNIPLPPKQRPRLYLRSCHIPELASRMQDPVLSKVWAELKQMSEDKGDGQQNRSGWRDFVVQRGDSVKAEMDALQYLITKDPKIGQSAIETALNLMISTHYPPEVSDIARASGRLMVTAAIVYDWCYNLLTAEEKEAFVEQFIRFAKTLECGYPPTEQVSITGHSSEWMIMRDLISAAIAIYDEYPEMYKATALRLFREHFPARNWFYPAHIYHQGASYDKVRFAADMYATWIFDRMGAGNVFEPSQQFIAYSWFYRRRPDKMFIAGGDSAPFRGKPQPVGTAAMLAASYYKDQYINYEYIRRPSVDSRDKFFEFIWRDTHLNAQDYRNLPLSRHYGSPFGWTIARTGWGSDSVIAEFKINVYNFLNHQHHDAGAFQIYHKGSLALDSGAYKGSSGGYNSPHNKNYFKRTIAHNSILVYDPDEIFETIGYGGEDKTLFADNDGGQLLPANGWFPPRVLEDLLDESNNYKTGEIIAQGFGPDYNQPEYTYLKGDITDAYSDKVSEIKRSFVFLNLKNDSIPAAVIIYDKVVSSNKDFKKFWLLHSIEEPQIKDNTSIITRQANNCTGKLANKTILPEPSNTDLNIIGGKGKEFWVFGSNYKNDALPDQDPGNERGSWRIELSPKKASEEDYFLNVMQIMDTKQNKLLPVNQLKSDKLNAVQIGNRVVAFSKNSNTISQPITLRVNGDRVNKVLITDLASGTWQVIKDGNIYIPAIPVRDDDNILYFEGEKGDYQLLR